MSSGYNSGYPSHTRNINRSDHAHPQILSGGVGGSNHVITVAAPQPDTLMFNLLNRALDLCVQVGVIQSSSCHMNGCWVSGKGPMSFEETARYLADLISSKGSSEKMAQWPTYQEELLDTMSRIGERMMEKRESV